MNNDITSGGARNPKTAKFSVSLTSDMNNRLEYLADVSGTNKGSMAAICIAIGVNAMEAIFLKNIGQYIDQSTADRSSLLASDIDSAR